MYSVLGAILGGLLGFTYDKHKSGSGEIDRASVETEKGAVKAVPTKLKEDKAPTKKAVSSEKVSDAE
jgi:hypothetical protein